MLGPTEIAAVESGVKDAIDIFDRIAGQIKTVLMRRPKEAEADDERWRYKISGKGQSIIVKSNDRVVLTITGDQLCQRLRPEDLRLALTYELKMDEYFRLWQAVYREKDSSQDPLVNAKTDEQLKRLIVQMKPELLGILAFLEKIGVHRGISTRLIYGFQVLIHAYMNEIFRYLCCYSCSCSMA